MDDASKQENLRQFRPNLANPANKEVTRELDSGENQRCEQFYEVSKPVTAADFLTANSPLCAAHRQYANRTARHRVGPLDQLLHQLPEQCARADRHI